MRTAKTLHCTVWTDLRIWVHVRQYLERRVQDRPPATNRSALVNEALSFLSQEAEREGIPLPSYTEALAHVEQNHVYLGERQLHELRRMLAEEQALTKTATQVQADISGQAVERLTEGLYLSIKELMTKGYSPPPEVQKLLDDYETLKERK